MKITDAIACPWCGEKDRDMLMIIQTGYPTRPRKNVWCSMCNVTGPEGINEKSAIEQWNARAGGQQPVASKTAGTKHVGISDLLAVAVELEETAAECVRRLATADATAAAIYRLTEAINLEHAKKLRRLAENATSNS